MTIEELRVKITAKIDGLQEGIKKATSKLDSFRKTTDNMVSANQKNIDRMKAQYDQLLKKLDNINAQAEMQQRKLEELRERYSRMGSMADTPKGMKLQEEILRTESRLLNLISTSDKTAQKLWELEEKMNAVGSSTAKANNRFRSLRDRLDQIRERFKRMGNETKRSAGRIAGFATMLDRSFRRVLRRLFIYNLLYRGIRGLISYMGAALKTNQQFVHSLNIIKTNLRVAFQPIFDFILPALNALMRAVATVTTYIAAAISALFGKSYKQSFNAAKKMNQAITGTWKAAKKAGKEVKGALAPFDEINQLMSGPDGAEDAGAGSGDFEMTAPDLSTIDMSGIEKFKEIMSKIFEPIKKAWKAEGQNTINAIKYALNEVKELIKAIGKSWLEVWTNGTGQQTVEHILRILQNIFNTVGNLAKAFRKSWEENKIGTRIIQNIADIINTILSSIERITGVTAEWAKGLDFTPLLESVNKLLEALKPFTENIGQGLAWLWENVLLPLASWTIEDVVPRFFELLANVLEILNGVIEAFKPLGTWLWDSFLLPIAQWTGGIIISVLDGINTGLQKLGDWIKEHQGAIQTIAILAGSFAAAWGLVNGAISTWNTIGKIASGVTDTFRTAVSFLKSPTTIAIAVIGGLIAVGIYLYKNWDEISAKLKSIWQSIKTKASEIWGSIKSFLINTIWNPIKNTAKTVWDGVKNNVISPIQNARSNLSQTWNNIKTHVLNRWNEIRTGISNTKNSLVNAIKSPFNIAKDWINGIIRDAKNWGRNLISSVVDGIYSMIGRVRDAASSVANTIFRFLGFSSPTKEGPGSTADKWMPNMMDMLAQGIKENTFKIESAVNMTANTLSGIQRPDNASSIIDAITGALSGRDGDLHLTIKIGEDTITEKIISNINRQNRIAGKTVIQV